MNENIDNLRYSIKQVNLNQGKLIQDTNYKQSFMFLMFLKILIIDNIRKCNKMLCFIDI